MSFLRRWHVFCYDWGRNIPGTECRSQSVSDSIRWPVHFGGNFAGERVLLKMKSIIVLANEIPWVMAPASLIAAMLATSLIRAVIQFTEKAFKVMAVGIILALTGGISVVLFLY